MVLAVIDLLFNTWIYNLISVPRMTRFLLEDAINSSKTDPQNGSKNEKRSYGKVKTNKTYQKYCHLFEFFILNNNQYSVMLCRLKFEKNVYLTIRFSV